ncbi:uncharacterized protein [Cherax quadricarinatus]
MDSGQGGSDGHQVEILRQENEEVKQRLANLQHEFSLLEDQVQMLVAERRMVEEQQRVEKEAQEQAYISKLQQYQATIAALDHCNTTLAEDPPIPQTKVEGCQPQEAYISNDSVVQMLAERCHTLEQANKKLQNEARAQQRQYEVCLDRVATQVVQALLSQKSHQEQCIKLAHQVKDLRRQNAALSSLVGPVGMRQTLPCSHRHRCPPPPPAHQTNFFSLPTSLTKNRQHNETWPSEGWVASWHVEESSRSHLGDHTSSQSNFHSSLQMLSDTSIPTTLSLTDHNTTRSSSVRLGEDCCTPQERLASTTTTITTANSTTTTCWYDIITSLSAANSPQGTGVISNQDSALNPRICDGINVWGHSGQIMCETERVSSTSSSSSESPVESSFHSHAVNFSKQTGGSVASDGCERSGEVRGCMSFPPDSDSATSKFSPLSLESTSTSISNSPEQKNCQVFQTKIDNLAFDKSKIKVVHEEDLISKSSSEKHTNLVNSVSSDEICSIRQVKEKLMRSLTEPTNSDFTIDLSVLSCDDKHKGVLNKNINKIGIKNVGNENNMGEESVEGATKDEGYSTMSSDVQADVKDSITTCTVTTVQEEPLVPTPIECPEQDLANTVAVSLSRKGSNKSDNNSLERNLVKEKKMPSAANSEYCDGLRIIYDEEDNNSDVFFVPIQEPENENLYRHSYHVTSSVQRHKPVRCYSDSQLYFEKSVHNPKPITSLERHVSEKDLADRSASIEEVLEEANKTRSLKRSSGHASLKRSRMYAKEEHTTSDSSEELWPLEENQRKYLSPTYSHAELEDWSLDLSSEYLSGACGEGEGSESAGTCGAHHGSLPSIQEATPELEEDNNEFLWNGATYFKADLDLNWSSKKELTKSWQLDHSKDNHIVLSPRSGCSDQPAVWSSSEQLSCCSEGISKCSSDFENFCEQICNLPELKRVSFCSSEAGGQEASKAASQETSSVGEHEEELADDVCVDTVFTRDFYRLVKFESNKSLAASSKSLATSDGLLTIEKLQDLESGGTHKEALASVLGFIAEQQKYCKEREAQDEKVTGRSRDILKLATTIENSGSPLASVLFRGTFPKISPREAPNDTCSNSADDFSMRTLPSLQWKPTNGGSSKTKVPPPVPAKPKSCLQHELAIGAPSSNFIPARCPPTASPSSLPVVPPSTLPVLPATSQPVPFVPSRSSSLAPQVIPACEVELPLSHISKVPIRSASHLPGTNSITEKEIYSTPSDGPCHQSPVPDRNCSIVPMQPTVDGPPVPRRSTSMAFPCNVLPVPEHKVSLTESPPVPKRITSRALPKPPSARANHLLVQLNSNGSSKPLGGSLEGKRRSFIKETLGLSSPKRPQSDYCELPSLSENPAGMLEELQRMAKVEEEEEKRRRLKPGGTTGAEVTSPGDTVGLGTGWVRVQPHVDLQDPQARANLLDGMMESSEGCSSETEDDEVADHHYSQLRSMHRSRRKRKVSHRSGGGGRIIIGSGAPRPTVIGRKDLFVRYGEQEKAALQEFEFLCDFSTSHSDLGSQDLTASSGRVNKSIITTSTSVLLHTDTSAFPYMSRSVGAVLPKVESNIFKKSISNFEEKNRSNLEEKNRTGKSDVSECNRGCQGLADEQEGVDTRSIGSVKSAIRQLNKVNHISGIKQPATMPTIPARSASSTSSTRANHYKSSSPVSTNKTRAWTPTKSKVSDRNIIGASKCSVRQGNSPSSRTPSPQFRVKDKGISNKSSSGSHSSVERALSSNTKTSSPTRIPRIQTSLMSSKKAAESSTLQRGDTSKDFCCESTKKFKTQCEKSLPPKGFSSRAVKPSPRIRSSLQQRQQQQQNLQQQSNKSGIRSPRLARLKKADPLESFTGKSLCDSGSSEGSERCGGRLSLSDSCAENFSPIDSGDEVFYKDC